MSGYNNWSDESDFDGEGGSQGGGGLRKMLEETLAENKRLVKMLEDQGKEQREESTAALLKAKGLDPAIAELIPEGTDAKAWVDKYAHLLGVPQNTPPLESEKAVEPEVHLSDDTDPAIVARRAELAAEQKALADMQEAAQAGISASVHDDLVSKMDKLDSEEDLLKFFRENGAPVVD